MNEAKVKLGLKECLNHGVIRNLGLIELDNSIVVQLKCTIILQNNTVYKLTGGKLVKLPNEKLTNELNNILKQSQKFDKRINYWDKL